MKLMRLVIVSLVIAVVTATAQDQIPGRKPLRQKPIGSFERNNQMAADFSGFSNLHSTLEFSSRPNRAIPDGNSAGVRDSIGTPELSIAYVQVRIDTLWHSYVGDLFMSLVSPRGDSVTLMNHPGEGRYGSNGANFLFTVFSDTAERSIDSITYTDLPHTGYWRNDPQPPFLFLFNGMMPAGDWVVHVNDVLSPDAGTLVRWTLIVTENDSLTSPLIVHSPLRDVHPYDTRTVGATILDFDGIGVGVGAPRLWHRASTGINFTDVVSDSTDGSEYYFTIPGYPDGTTVEYYIAAQDASPLGNVSTFPVGGSGSSPPGSTPPPAFLSFLISSSIVVVIDTVFTPEDYPDAQLTATIFIPRPAISRGVAAVLGHGYGADRFLFLGNWADSLAANGYVAMTIDFADLDQPEGLFPKPVRAFKTAVEFLRRNATRFGVFTDQIIGVGGSQGSFVWGESITWDNDDDYFGTDPAVDDHLDAVVLLYGVYDTENNLPYGDELFDAYYAGDDSSRFGKGSPIANACNITTPTLLLHGISDQIVPIIQSTNFCDSLDACGRSCQLIPFPGDHGFDVTQGGQFTLTGRRALDSALQFLDLVTSVKESGEETLPSAFALHQNFPNPFNPATTIGYELLYQADVQLAVYNILGQHVATLVNERQGTGRYSIGFDGTRMTSGVYFYRLEAGKFVDVKKLLLVK